MRRKPRLALIALAVIATCFVAMVTVYALPREPIRAHVAQSADILYSERDGLEPLFGIDGGRLDNFSDAIMLNAAVGLADQSPLERALDIRVGTTSGRMVYQHNVVASMALAADPEFVGDTVSDPANTFSYARYWHGYQVVLRPALMLLSYPALRYINAILWLAATAGLTALISRKLGGRYAAAFLVALSFFSPLTIPASLSFAGDFYLAYALSAAALIWGSRERWSRIDLELFLVVGMLTSFVDLLIIPLLTLTLPLAFLLLLQAKRTAEYDWRHGLTTVSRAALAWGAGYVSCWIAKWIIGSALLGENILLEAAAASVHRMSGPVLGNGFHGFGPVFSNVALLVPGFGIETSLPGSQPEVIIALVVVVGLIVLAALALLLRFRHRPRRWSTLVPLAVVAALPYFWYIALASHSERHYWFTYRIQLVTLFALAATYVSLLDWEAVRGAGRFVRWKLTRR